MNYTFSRMNYENTPWAILSLHGEIIPSKGDLTFAEVRSLMGGMNPFLHKRFVNVSPEWDDFSHTQPGLTCSKLIKETLGNGEKYFQS